ncbi:hypothetical protein DRW03_21945 [Corallococcus sp. H22C18031201]|uniref:hypothetical protein n=1 Tax=Citreicoccus inhibens TaxID=2849499 RepID=UPI000E75F4B9|nr:hypothetical protein [Citreicoccus inhibens]MBU8897061.1 hypothetical protein [Citreicoccus inhibens]RJS19682.1 hypothetical protein DRW03_21945 [Corallococcus sp. H22C18031201]
MEWLDFQRWSPEVQRKLALQVSRLERTVAYRRAAPVKSASTLAHRMCTLLRKYTRTNPWGHPASEC